MSEQNLYKRLNELADKLIEGGTSATEDKEFQALYAKLKLQKEKKGRSKQS